MNITTKYDIESNFAFQQGEAVFLEIISEPEHIVQTGIVISPTSKGINDEITILVVNFNNYHDLPLTNEKSRKATGFNPIERSYTYSTKKIDFLDIKNGKVKLYKVAAVEPVFFDFTTPEAAQTECDKRNRKGAIG